MLANFSKFAKITRKINKLEHVYSGKVEQVFDAHALKELMRDERLFWQGL
jgi:hypothetical protein